MDFYPDYFILCSSADIIGLFLTDIVEHEGHLLFCLTRDEDGIPPHILIPWVKFQSSPCQGNGYCLAVNTKGLGEKKQKKQC